MKTRIKHSVTGPAKLVKYKQKLYLCIYCRLVKLSRKVSTGDFRLHGRSWQLFAERHYRWQNCLSCYVEKGEENWYSCPSNSRWLPGDWRFSIVSLTTKLLMGGKIVSTPPLQRFWLSSRCCACGYQFWSCFGSLSAKWPWFKQLPSYLFERKNCRVALPGQSFVSSDSERCLLQDEDHSGRRPHSFPGLCRMRSGTSPYRFRSGSELAGSEEGRQDGTMRLKCGFPSYWTPGTTSLLLYPQFPQKLEWYSPLVICEYLSFVPSYS